MDAQLVVAVLLAIGFAVTNGLHDASNAIATRAATPLQAILLASVFNLLGPLFLGQPSPTRSAASSPSRRTWRSR
jgi:phosphate/sulfate permease